MIGVSGENKVKVVFSSSACALRGPWAIPPSQLLAASDGYTAVSPVLVSWLSRSCLFCSLELLKVL